MKMKGLFNFLYQNIIISFRFYLNNKMQISKIVILILALSFLLQIFNFVNVAYSTQVYTALDVINPPYSGYPSFMQQNNGNRGYIAVGAAISSIIYLYLFIIKIIKKSCSQKMDQVLLLLTLCLQFGIIVTYFNFLRNNQVRFDYALKIIDNLEAIQQTLPPGDPIPDLLSYRKLFVLRSMTIAASILTLLICVFGGFFLVLRQNFQYMQLIDQSKQRNGVVITQMSQSYDIEK